MWECFKSWNNKIMWGQIFQDAFFAAIAAIGFAAISRPPKPGYLYCAIIAALGHASRFIMMNSQSLHAHIIIASLFAALIIGVLARLFLSYCAHSCRSMPFPGTIANDTRYLCLQGFWRTCYVRVVQRTRCIPSLFLSICL